MRRVLVVDDEPHVIDGLRKSLRVFRESWEVEVALGGAKALECLAQRHFDVVVTDARMPEVDGEAVLRRLCEVSPESLRVVLTGEVKRDVATRLLALAHQFLSKPVKAVELFERVEESLRVQAELKSPALQKLIGEFGPLPAVPGTFSAINQLLEDPDAQLPAFVTVVERDPAVSAAVLRLVNSAYFGMPTRVASLKEAVRLLGVEPLQNLVLAAEVFEGRGALAGQLQREAIVRLGRLRQVIRDGAAAWVEPACTGAVLCDLGRLLLMERCPEAATACEAEVARGGERAAVEAEHFGVHHGLVGAALLGLWGVPRPVVDAVALHHLREGPVAAMTPTLALGAVCLVEEALGASAAHAEVVKERLGRLAPSLVGYDARRLVEFLDGSAARG
jgi:HD-like signal output (HDOD) protein/ActR/RegA family two-component response regulator